MSIADLLDQQRRVDALCICCGKLALIKAGIDGRTPLCVDCYIVAEGLEANDA